MGETFGKTLRDFRVQTGVGLRELARLIDKSAGYLSDLENGRVPPPSEAVILDIARVLQVDKNALLMAARKVDPELSNYVVQQPQAADFLRMAKDQEFNDEDWERVNQLARIAKLGKGEEDKE